MSQRLKISIIGAGKVGTAIGVLAARAGYRVAAVASSGRESAQAAADAIRQAGAEEVVAVEPAAAAAAGELVLLTTPDDAIETVCCELAEAGAFTAGSVVAHCCGALGSDILSPAAKLCGAKIGSMHPLQTFPTTEAALKRFAGTHCFIEGDDEARAVLVQLAESIGGVAESISPEGKAAYHAAGVMACNYLTALLDAAASLAESANIAPDRYLQAVGPMVRATVENVLTMGPASALTGPIARGDVDTIRRHVEAMRPCTSELRDFYRAAATWTVQLAKRKTSIDAARAAELIETLNELRK